MVGYGDVFSLHSSFVNALEFTGKSCNVSITLSVSVTSAKSVHTRKVEEIINHPAIINMIKTFKKM